MHRGQQVRDRGAYGCSMLWSTPTVIQQLVEDGERKRVRGGKYGKPTSNSLSFSITRCRLLRQGVCYIPHTLPVAAGRGPLRPLTHYPTPLGQ